MNIFQRVDHHVYKKIEDLLNNLSIPKNNDRSVQMEKLAKITSFLAKLIDELVGSFLEIEGKTREDIAKKISINFIGRFFYGVTDWIVAFGLGALAFFANFRRDIFITEQSIFGVIFLWNFLWASLFFWVSHKSELDFTWGKAYKRVMDVLWKHGIWGKILSILYGIYISVKAIAWEGPEVICCVYQKQLKTRSNIWVALYLFSAIQGICGYFLYKTAYGLAEEYNIDFSSGIKVAALGVLVSIAFLGVFSLIGKFFRLSTDFLRNNDINPILRTAVFICSIIILLGFISFIGCKGLSR